MKIFIFQDVDSEICAVNSDFIVGLSTALSKLGGIFHSHVGDYFRIYDTINEDFIYKGDINPDKMWEVFKETLTCKIWEVN